MAGFRASFKGVGFGFRASQRSSVVESKTVIADYADTAGKLRPFAIGRAVIDLSRVAKPPLRLPPGTDTEAANEAKNAFVSECFSLWRAVGVSTDLRRVRESSRLEVRTG